MKVVCISKKSVLTVLVLFGLSACGRSANTWETTEFVPPKSEMPFPVSCAKPEAEQTIGPEAKANAQLLEDEIKIQDIEYVDCDGRLTSKDHGPINGFERLVTIEAPENLAQEVTAVEIENPRTCMQVQTRTQSLQTRVDKIQLPNGTEMDLAKLMASTALTTVENTGRLSLAVNNSHLQVISRQLSLAPGANVIQIRYFGRCLESDPKDKTKCAHAEPIGSREVLLDMKLTRREIPGVNRVRECEKDAANENVATDENDPAKQD